MTNYPDFWLIAKANVQDRLWADWSIYFKKDYDIELESRIPIFNPEYDATGQIITSELMGYTEEGEEIWS